jgi:type VI secretion system secreted protein VgrG
MEVFADQSINVTSTNNAILVEAQQKIVLQAGQSAIMLDGGNITFTCPGTFSVKGVAHQFSGGARDVAVLGALPSENLKFRLPNELPHDEQFILKDGTGKPLAGMAYTAKLPSNQIVHGVTDEDGKTERFETDNAQKIDIHIGHIDNA